MLLSALPFARCSPYTWTTKSLERKPSILSASPFYKGAFADRVTGDIRKLQRTPESGGGQPLPGTRTWSTDVCHRTGPRCLEMSLQKAGSCMQQPQTHAAQLSFPPTPAQASKFSAHHMMVLKHKGLIQILWKQAHALDRGGASQKAG